MSEDQERSQQEEHWRELAQLLGVGSEAPAVKPVAAKAPASAPVEAKAPPPPPPEPQPVMTVAEFHDEVVASPIVEETSVEEPARSDDTTGEETETGSDWRDAEEDRPRRGKRRRGRRGRREDRPPSRLEEKAPDLEEADEEQALPEDSENGEEETEDAAEPVEAQTEEDLDVDNTLRDWNVPSWNELIASLYRPDR